MQLGIPFMEGLGGTQIGVEIDKDSFYIGIQETHKLLSIKYGMEYYSSNGESLYKKTFKKDIEFLICKIKRVC